MSDEKPNTPRRENLWPQIQIKPASQLRTPLFILKDQAALLGQMTRNIIKAEVRTFKASDSAELVFGFTIVAPALDNYSLLLFTVAHTPTRLYPVVVESDVIVPAGKSITRWTATSEPHLKRILKIIFSHPVTSTAINSLMAQSLAPEGRTPVSPSGTLGTP